MRTATVSDLIDILASEGHIPPISPAELAESLRAMHRAARAHYSPAGGPDRVAIVMERWRLSHLVSAAELIDADAAVTTWKAEDEQPTNGKS